MGGIRKNIIYSSLLVISTYLVPLFVFPYISRILGPVNIGAIDTVEYVIDFCILCSMLGLTTFGIREIAKVRDDKEELSKTFSNLFFLNLVTTLVVISVLVILMICVPFFIERRFLLLVGILKIVANLFWIEWFFKGLEDFRYITLRSLIVRLMFILSVYIFVKEQTDSFIYYLLWVSIYVCNAVFNWIYVNKFTVLSVKNLNLKRYIKPFFLLGAFAFLSAIYTQLNVPFLQYITGENSEVAFYTTSVRMYKIFIALFSAISGVMIPRMSVLVNENKFDQISKLVDKNFRLLFYFALPIILFTFVFAGDFISIIAGDEFVSADNPMRLAMLMLIIIGTEQIFILQILIPMRCDKEIVIAALSGVIVFVFFSFPIVSVYKSLGSVIIWMLSEFVVLLFVSYNVKKKINILFPFTFFIKALLISLPLFIIGSFIYYLVQNVFLRLIVGSVVFLVYSLILDLKFYKLGIANRLSKLVFKLSK